MICTFKRRIMKYVYLYFIKKFRLFQKNQFYQERIFWDEIQLILTNDHCEDL